MTVRISRTKALAAGLIAILVSSGATQAGLSSCCHPDGTCTTPVNCSSGSPCDSGEGVCVSVGSCGACPGVGACCDAGGICSLTESDDCASGYQGDGTDCDPDPCPQPAPTGACCVDGSCSIEIEADCAGTYLGDGATCTSSGTYSSTPGAAIPDNNPGSPAMDTITVPDSFIVGDINVALVIDHTWVGDLIVTLEHGGTTVTLIERPGVPATTFGCTGNDYDIVLDDEGLGGPVETLCGPSDAAPNPTSPPNYAPNNPLSAFDGMDSAGDWILRVSDNVASDTGTLIEWSLIFDSGGNPCVEPTGACCVPGTDCTVETDADCPGVYIGDLTSCTPDPCPQACCFPSGACLDLNPADCAAQNGVGDGVGSYCAAAQCPQPIGACCVASTCSIQSESDCGASGGTFLGDGTVCTNFSYFSGPDDAIPDNDPGNPATNTINVPDSFTVGDLNVRLDIDHTWVGDLIVTLEHGGITVTLIDRPGVPAMGAFGCSGNDYGIVVDDQGTGGAVETSCVDDPSSNPTSPPNYVPNNPLSAFAGMDAAGDWILRVSDNAAGDLGSVQEWSLDFDSDNACIVPTGACCFLGGGAAGSNVAGQDFIICSETTPESCANLAGEYHGDGTDCDPNPCRGACCVSPPVNIPDFCIDDSTALDCGPLFETFYPGQTCAEIECGSPTGACCFDEADFNVAGNHNGPCQEITRSLCESGLGGEYQGDGTTCDEVLCNPDRVDISHKGSLLIFSDVELEWNPLGPIAGFVPANPNTDTIISLTNDYPGEVYVQMYFINGDPELDPVFSTGPSPVLLADGEPGCNWVDCQVLLTPDQSVYWSAASGNPLGCQPFSILDPDLGSGPGRPNPDADDETRVLRGYVIAWAVSAAGEEINWNHLSGKATIVDYTAQSAWEYDAWGFQSHIGSNGDPLPFPGILELDGFEYDQVFDLLLFDFFGSGSQALSVGTSVVTADTDLSLHPVSADLRQETEGPITTKAHFDIWNMNERKLSNTRRCITCWDQSLLSIFNSPNTFLLGNLQSDKGKARIDGLQADECEENCFRGEMGEPLEIEELLELLGDLFNDIEVVCSEDAALLGVAAKILTFNGAIGSDRAGSPLIGMGFESARIQYDIITPPGSLREESFQRIGRSSLREYDRLEDGKRKPRG